MLKGGGRCSSPHLLLTSPCKGGASHPEAGPISASFAWSLCAGLALCQPGTGAHRLSPAMGEGREVPMGGFLDSQMKTSKPHLPSCSVHSPGAGTAGTQTASPRLLAALV